MNESARLLIDSLFKILLITFLGVFLFLYYQNIKSNRYANIESIRNISMFDKMTGKIYVMNGGRLYRYDPINGKSLITWAEDKDETKSLRRKARETPNNPDQIPGQGNYRPKNKSN